MRSYLRFTRHYYYSLLMVVPIFIAYEIGILWVHHTSQFHVRNLIDYFSKYIISHTGSSGFFCISVLGLVLLIIIARPKRDFLIFHISYFFWMLAESIIYSFLFAYLGECLGDFVQSCAISDVHHGMAGVILSLGAGIYEELFFRALLFGGTACLLTSLFRLHLLLSAFIAMVISSAFFSLIHFWGNFADDFGLYSFLFRFVAGIFFCVFYKLRGFAVVVHTHAIYDLLVTFDVFK